MRGTSGVTKLGAELVNDEGETSRNLVEHCVAERPINAALVGSASQRSSPPYSTSAEGKCHLEQPQLRRP